MSRAMIVVGGGTSSRFGADKLMADIDGLPLIAYTIDAIVGHVDHCVVVCRSEIVEDVRQLRPDVEVVVGGATRTSSEMAGLAALGGEAELIGIHDAARPLVNGSLIALLFELAAQFGGAIPALLPDRIVVDKETQDPVRGVRLAQTPQVFESAVLRSAYSRAADAGYDGHDTAEVVDRFGDTTIVTIPGDPANVKVTFPSDLEAVSRAITGRSRT